MINLKNIRILFLVLFNVVQFLISIWGFTVFKIVLSMLFGLPALLLSYFLLKGSKKAFYLMLVWFAVQTFTFNFPDFSFAIYFGYFFDLHIMNSPIGFNPFTAIMFFILLSTKKLFLLKENTEELEPSAV